MRTKLPQVQPWLCFGIWPEAECIPADRHSHKTCPVRGLLCHPPALNRAQESSLPSVFAAIPHQQLCFQTRQNNLGISFAVAHTHTALLVCWKQLRLHWWWICPCARLAHVKAGESRVQSLLHCHQWSFTWLALSIIFLCGEAEPQRLVFLSAAFEYSRAGPRRGSGQLSTCKDRKWILVGFCWWRLSFVVWLPFNT